MSKVRSSEALIMLKNTNLKHSLYITSCQNQITCIPAQTMGKEGIELSLVRIPQISLNN